MTRSSVGAALVASIVVQFVVLLGMVTIAAMPLWTGTEIHVKTVPVDPRSMFRGNYARLNYGFATLPDNATFDSSRLRIGEVVYVKLRADTNGLYRFASVSLKKPDEGVFLRGRIANNYPPYRVNYGIEAFFAPKEKALQLEEELRDGGIAVLMVADSGRVALRDVVPDAVED
jgi:uncharacterized membrane-anchored protein